MTGLEDEITRYQKAVEELREQNQLAHANIRDLNAARKSLLDLRKQWIDSTSFQDKVDEAIGPELKRSLDTIVAGMREVEKKTLERFDEIILICLSEDPVSVKEGKRTVIELVKDFVEVRHLPVHITVETHLMMNSNTKRRQEQKSAKRVRAVTGSDFENLPLLIDESVKDDMAILFLPSYENGKPAQFIMNLRTGQGVRRASEAVGEVMKRDTEKIPAGLRRPGQLLPETVYIETEAIKLGRPDKLEKVVIREPQKRKAGPA